MKERIIYDKYKDFENKGTWVYYKKKQYLTWRFFLRVIHKWFTPCKKCQEEFNTLWDAGYSTNRKWYEGFIERVIMKLCTECSVKIAKDNAEAEVILGNNDYSPPIELSRRWIDDDESFEDITKVEYHKHMSHR